MQLDDTVLIQDPGPQGQVHASVAASAPGADALEPPTGRLYTRRCFTAVCTYNVSNIQTWVKSAPTTPTIATDNCNAYRTNHNGLPIQQTPTTG